ncbi:MAG: MBL fold metallo-hydrolase [Thermodesulfobacteriota bacterium]|nr:MBL fold metallo-hydrolase [Thermodesulfobacteriota bacterium]
MESTEITVTILGSGTCVPSLKRSACSVLLDINGSKLLFDSGPGTMRRLLETGTTISDISFIFYSHLHPDHTGELVNFLFATKYPDENSRTIPLTIIAGHGFSTFYKKLKNIYGNWIELSPGLLTILELDNTSPDSIGFDHFTVKSIPVEHTEESIAYRVNTVRGKSVVYSGDTDFNENLITLAKKADLLICESAMPDELKVTGHLTPSLSGEIATRANVGKLVLTHFYPECDHTDIKKQCRKTWSGPLVLAEDLMNIDFI